MARNERGLTARWQRMFHVKQLELVLGKLFMEHLLALTPREQDVVILLALGLGNKEVACELGISERTVHTYVWKICRKWGVCNRTQAGMFAVDRYVPLWVVKRMIRQSSYFADEY